MEPIGAMSEGVWSSLSGMYASEEADFMAQLLDTSTNFWPNHESTMSLGGVDEVSLYSSDNSNYNMYNFFRGSNTISGASSSHPILMNNSSSMSTEFCSEDAATNTSLYFVEYDDTQKKEMSSGNAEEADKIQSEPRVPPEPPTDGISDNPSQNSKKRSRNTGEVSESDRK